MTPDKRTQEWQDLTETEKLTASVEGWTEEARRSHQNVDFWRGKAKAAEAQVASLKTALGRIKVVAMKYGDGKERSAIFTAIYNEAERALGAQDAKGKDG